MAEEVKVPQNPLAKLEQQLAAPKSLKDMFNLDLIKDRFIANYQAVTGKKDGQNRYEAERFAYLEIIADKPDLQKLDRFYHFAAIVKAGTTGLSFRDNKLYIIPTGNGLKVQSSPAGKREQMEMMVDIKRVPEPVLVMTGDKFTHDKLNGKVVEHITTDKSTNKITLENIVASYQRIYFTDGTIQDVVVYHDDLVKAKDKSKMKSDQGFWQTWPGEAAKKTSTNRAHRLFHKYPDNVVVYGNDSEDETQDTTYTEAEPDQTAIETFRPDVNENTGEVYEDAQVDKKTKKPGKEPEKFV